MLSIGKLAAGQARYYLEQAEGRVDVVESVGDGIEDYYSGGAEARGEWVGIGSRRLGLGGAVDGTALRHVLGGGDPWSGEPLRGSRSPVRVAGFDLTFSAPKSVSVLFGTGDAAWSEQYEKAHDHAVVEAVSYLERSAAAVRRGSAGAEVVEADGLIAAAFRHRSSRAGDPQLHSHVLVANLGRGADGRWSALDGRRLYSHARAASFIYQAVLRSELTRSLGVEWSSVHQGIGEIRGVPVAVMRAFSQRRADIEAALEARGASGPRAAEAAALATRERKRAVEPSRLSAEWRRRALAAGMPEHELLVGRGGPERVDEDTWARMAADVGPPRRAHERAVDVQPARRHPGVVRSPAGRRDGGRTSARGRRRSRPRRSRDRRAAASGL